MASTNLISAYFAICFPSFTYYVTTLSCTIGRRCTPNSNIDAVPVHVDIDLGPLKSVSRLHARIEYDEDTEGFVICILGRNGAWIDGNWAKSGSRVPLATRTNIQIASRTFQFLLATPPQDRLQTEPFVGQSPTSSLVDVIDSDPVSSPRPTLRDTSLPAQPPLPLPTLCCHAIEALGGKATLGQIRRWLMAEHEWYRLNDGWQASIRSLLSTDPIFYKVRREKSHKGKDSFYSFRSEVAGKEGVEPHKTGGGDADSTALIDVEGDVIDVDGIDDPPPLPVKRSAAHSTSSSIRPAKKSKVAKTVPRKSLADAATASNVSKTTQPSPPITAEERRLNRRRAELESKIHAALEARSTGVPASESNRIVCIPIRFDIRPSPSTTDTPMGPTSAQPLALKNGEIVLSSKLFSHVSTEQLRLLRRLETPKVLEILTAEFKKSLVEEYRVKKAKAKPAPSTHGTSLTANINSAQ